MHVEEAGRAGNERWAHRTFLTTKPPMEWATKMIGPSVYGAVKISRFSLFAKSNIVAVDSLDVA